MSTVDFVVGIVMILSIVLAVLRGFTREVLTIVAFVGAVVAVVFGLPIAGPLFQQFFKDSTTANIAAGIVLGLVTLVVLSLLAHQIAKGVNKAGLGMVDRTLGAVFGAARAALVLCLVYIAINWAAGGNMPGWLTEAKSTPFIAQGAEQIVAILPENIQNDIKPDGDKTKQDKAELLNKAEKSSAEAGAKIDGATAGIVDKIDAEKAKLEKPPAPPEKPEPAKDSEGYGKSDRGDLNNLIEKDQKQAQ